MFCILHVLIFFVMKPWGKLGIKRIYALTRLNVAPKMLTIFKVHMHFVYIVHVVTRSKTTRTHVCGETISGEKNAIELGRMLIIHIARTNIVQCTCIAHKSVKEGIFFFFTHWYTIFL